MGLFFSAAKFWRIAAKADRAAELRYCGLGQMKFNVIKAKRFLPHYNQANNQSATMKVLLNFHCSALYCISIIPSIKVFAELFSKSDRTLSIKFRCTLNVERALNKRIWRNFQKGTLHCIAITPLSKFLWGFQRGTFFKKFPFGVS